MQESNLSSNSIYVNFNFQNNRILVKRNISKLGSGHNFKKHKKMLLLTAPINDLCNKKGPDRNPGRILKSNIL
jgi:hypothetical protein